MRSWPMRDISGRAVYRGALLGLGGVARQSHLPAYLGTSGVPARLRLVAALDDNPATTPVDGMPLVRSPSGRVGGGPLDFVDICTPTATHLELTRWALAEGFHVLCEKPVAVTRAEAAAIADAARVAGRVVVPCHQHRY